MNVSPPLPVLVFTFCAQTWRLVSKDMSSKLQFDIRKISDDIFWLGLLKCINNLYFVADSVTSGTEFRSNVCPIKS
jgi:hypothetical protein